MNFHSSLPTNCSESFKKGYLFEKYVRQLFHERNFKVLWRNSLVTPNKQLPLSYFSLPDLELRFIRKNTYRFAVECKWRQEFFHGKINWAREDQIRTYITYQKEENIRVFIAIGIGGEPSSPEKLFVTPLDYISNSTEIEEHDLIEFKRKPTRRFFYDTVQMKLF